MKAFKCGRFDAEGLFLIFGVYRWTGRNCWNNESGGFELVLSCNEMIGISA